MSWRNLFSAGVLFLLVGCAKHSSRSAKSKPVVSAAPTPSQAAAALTPAAYAKPLLVPHATGPIHCDGRAREPDWRHALRTGAFKDPKTGRVARPYSEARFLWDEKHLYVLFYAGDDDITATVKTHDAPLYLQDAFSLKLRPASAAVYDIDFAANGTTSDARELGSGKLDPRWESHAVVGVDRDGTLNNRRDIDEEWLVETAIPFASLGVKAHAGTRLSVQIDRCDTPLRGPRGCGAFAADPRSRWVRLELGSK